MSVVKGLRNLSTMEFYKNAIRLRKEITLWMVRDFGNTRNQRSVGQVIKNIDPADQQVIDEIFEKYGKTPNHQFQSEYPEWFVEAERQKIMATMQDLISHIIKANTVHMKAGCQAEYDLRRTYQDKAIGDVFVLYQELQYITDVFGTNLNRFTEILDMLDREDDLLKGWRQSENKFDPRNKKAQGKA